MPLPPRGDPERLEAMARNVALGLEPCHGDDGTAMAYSSPPPGYQHVPRNYDSSLPGLVDDPHLRYFGPYWGWYTKGPGTRKKEKQPAYHSRQPRNPKVFRYRGSLGEIRDLGKLSGMIKPGGDRN